MSFTERLVVIAKGTIGTTLILTALCASGDVREWQQRDFSSYSYSLRDFRTTSVDRYETPIESLGWFGIPVLLLWVLSPFLLALYRPNGRAAGCLTTLVGVSVVVVGGYCILSVLSHLLQQLPTDDSSSRIVTHFSWARMLVIGIGFALVFANVTALDES